MSRIKSYFQICLEEQEGRWIHWIAFSLAMGAGLYLGYPTEPDPHVVGISCFFACLVLFKSRQSYLTYRCVAVFAAFVVGFGLADVHTHFNTTQLLKKNIRSVNVEATVVDYDRAETGWKVYIEDIQYEKDRGYPKRLRVTIRQKSYTPNLGQRIQTRLSVMAPSEPLLPKSYDFQRHAFYKHVGGYGFAVDRVDVVSDHADHDVSLFKSLLHSYRDNIIHQIESLIPKKERGMAMALVAGEKTSISETQMEAIRNSGLAHILAISGLHVGLVAGILFFVFRYIFVQFEYLALRFSSKKVASVLTLFFSYFYMHFVGASVSTQRAMIMTGLVLLAVVFDRVALTLRTVAVAAIAILLMAPQSIAQPGFQMSFLAVIGLVAAYEVLNKHYYMYGQSTVSKAGYYVLGVILSTVIATIATMPPALYHFQQVAVWGVLANSIVMPLMVFVVMPLVVMILAFGWLPTFLLFYPLKALAWAIDFIQAVAEYIQDLHMSVVTVAAPETLLFIGTITGFIMAAIFRDVTRRSIAFSAFILCLLAMFITRPPNIVVPGDGAFVGIVEGKTLWLSNKGDGFTTDIVKSVVGASRIGYFKDEDAPVTCDVSGCLYTYEDRTIALPLSTEAMKEDCQSGQAIDYMVFNQGGIERDCPAVSKYRQFDFFDRYYNGGMSLYISKEGFERKLVERQKRMWAQ